MKHRSPRWLTFVATLLSFPALAGERVDFAAASRGLDRAQEASGGSAVVHAVDQAPDGSIRVIMDLPGTAAAAAEEAIATEPGVTLVAGATVLVREDFEAYAVDSQLAGQGGWTAIQGHSDLAFVRAGSIEGARLASIEFPSGDVAYSGFIDLRRSGPLPEAFAGTTPRRIAMAATLRFGPEWTKGDFSRTLAALHLGVGAPLFFFASGGVLVAGPLGGPHAAIPTEQEVFLEVLVDNETLTIEYLADGVSLATTTLAEPFVLGGGYDFGMFFLLDRAGPEVKLDGSVLADDLILSVER